MRSRPLENDGRRFGWNRQLTHRLLLAIIIACLIAGCALMRPTGSWVELGHQADAEPLSDAIVAFAAEALTAPGATIALAPVPDDQAANGLTLKVREKLVARGYRLGESGPADGAPLTYVVSNYRGRVLLRASFRQTEISVLFVRDDSGILGAGAPLARREKAKVH
jgi:hypothetical protein